MRSNAKAKKLSLNLQQNESVNSSKHYPTKAIHSKGSFHTSDDLSNSINSTELWELHEAKTEKRHRSVSPRRDVHEPMGHTRDPNT